MKPSLVQGRSYAVDSGTGKLLIVSEYAYVAAPTTLSDAELVDFAEKRDREMMAKGWKPRERPKPAPVAAPEKVAEPEPEVDASEDAPRASPRTTGGLFA